MQLEKTVRMSVDNCIHYKHLRPQSVQLTKHQQISLHMYSHVHYCTCAHTYTFTGTDDNTILDIFSLDDQHFLPLFTDHQNLARNFCRLQKRGSELNKEGENRGVSESQCSEFAKGIRCTNTHTRACACAYVEARSLERHQLGFALRAEDVVVSLLGAAVGGGGDGGLEGHADIHRGQHVGWGQPRPTFH